MDNTVGRLTQLEKSVIVGSLFGDGYARIISGKRNALLEINHGSSQKEYVDWKHEMLKRLCKSGPVLRKSNGTRMAYRFNTRQHDELTSLYNTFYIAGSKRVPRDIALDPLMLAVWYMDDGSKCRASDVYINTQQFTVNDQMKCAELLKKLGIESRLNRDKKYWRIRIKKSSLPRFFSLIRPYVIPSMMYKIGLEPVETTRRSPSTRKAKKDEDIVRSS